VLLRYAVVAGFALLLTSCTPTPPAREGIPIGFYGSLTGPTATFGQSGKNGSTLAFDEINASGGVLGKRITLHVEDDRGEPAEAASAVSKLISRDHVIGVLGEAASSRTLAAAPIAQTNEIPMITPSSTNPQVTRVGKYIFRMCFTDDFQGAMLARFASEDLKARTVVLLTDVRNDYSIGLGRAFRLAFEKRGGKILGEQRYAEGDTDFSAQLTQMKTTPADVIFVPGYYTDVGLIARQKEALGLSGILLGGDGWDSPRLTEIGGDALDGAFFGNHYSIHDPDPAVQRFVAAYRARFGDVPDSIGALAYDAARVFADAIRRAGSTSGTRIREALAATEKFAGVTGSITFDLERNPVKPIVILEIRKRTYAFVKRIQPESPHR